MRRTLADPPARSLTNRTRQWFLRVVVVSMVVVSVVVVPAGTGVGTAASAAAATPDFFIPTTKVLVPCNGMLISISK